MQLGKEEVLVTFCRRNGRTSSNKCSHLRPNFETCAISIRTIIGAREIAARMTKNVILSFFQNDESEARTEKIYGKSNSISLRSTTAVVCRDKNKMKHLTHPMLWVYLLHRTIYTSCMDRTNSVHFISGII